MVARPEAGPCSRASILADKERGMRRGSDLKRNVQLLATRMLIDGPHAAEGTGIANVLEFSKRTRLPESCRSLREGARVEVSFLVPSGETPFVKLSTTCLFGRARDRMTLHYEAQILDMGELSQRNFSACLSATRSCEESVS